MLQAVHCHTFFISYPLSLSLFCLKYPMVSVNQLQACPSPSFCSLPLFCFVLKPQLCEHWHKPVPVNFTGRGAVSVPSTLGLPSWLTWVFSLSPESLFLMLTRQTECWISGLLPLVGAQHRSFPCPRQLTSPPGSIISFGALILSSSLGDFVTCGDFKWVSPK